MTDFLQILQFARNGQSVNWSACCLPSMRRPSLATSVIDDAVRTSATAIAHVNGLWKMTSDSKAPARGPTAKKAPVRAAPMALSERMNNTRETPYEMQPTPRPARRLFGAGRLPLIAHESPREKSPAASPLILTRISGSQRDSRADTLLSTPHPIAAPTISSGPIMLDLPPAATPVSRIPVVVINATAPHTALETRSLKNIHAMSAVVTPSKFRNSDAVNPDAARTPNIRSTGAMTPPTTIIVSTYGTSRRRSGSLCSPCVTPSTRPTDTAANAPR